MACPNGCVSWTASAAHAARPNREHLEAAALEEEYDKARNRLCPACGRLMDMEASTA
jgi:acetone carboxylase gamma subunit